MGKQKAIVNFLSGVIRLSFILGLLYAIVIT